MRLNVNDVRMMTKTTIKIKKAKLRLQTMTEQVRGQRIREGDAC